MIVLILVLCGFFAFHILRQPEPNISKAKALVIAHERFKNDTGLDPDVYFMGVNRLHGWWNVDYLVKDRKDLFHTDDAWVTYSVRDDDGRVHPHLPHY
jgi:hypothetical protein